MATVNNLRGTPWFVGGGAQHSPEVARNMLAIASNRTQGITGTSDFTVAPLDVPGQGVKIGKGSALIRVGQTPDSQQTYSAFAQAVSTLDITPTGSSSGRSDMIVCRVEDPYIAGSGWQPPASPIGADFVHFRVIQGVPAGATSLSEAGRGADSAIPLARIDIPPSTGTITAGMIKDLRIMAMPRQVTATNIAQGTLAPTTLTSSTFTNWPASYNPGNRVPEWATHAQIRFWLSGIYTTGPCDGGIRMELWGPNFVPAIIGAEQKFDQDIPVAEYGSTPGTSTGGGAGRFSLSGGAYGEVFQFRHQLVYFRLGAYVLNRADRSPVTIDQKTALMYDITFYEKPI